MLFDHDFLLEIYNPQSSKLAPHTAAFAAELAASTPASDALTETLVIESLRETVATSLAGKSLPYPSSLTPQSYAKEIIDSMEYYVLRAKHSESVPTLVMFYGDGFERTNKSRGSLAYALSRRR